MHGGDWKVIVSLFFKLFRYSATFLPSSIGERKLANLNYELKEDGNGLTVKVWFAPELDLEDQAKVRGWIAWAKNAMERKTTRKQYSRQAGF